MADMINLRQARKAKARAEKEAQALGQRVQFGRTKAEKAASRAAQEKAARALDGHRRDES